MPPMTAGASRSRPRPTTGAHLPDQTAAQAHLDIRVPDIAARPTWPSRSAPPCCPQRDVAHAGRSRPPPVRLCRPTTRATRSWAVITTPGRVGAGQIYRAGRQAGTTTQTARDDRRRRRPSRSCSSGRGYNPPRWPDPAHPQQSHLELAVDDIETPRKRARLAPPASPGRQIFRRLRGPCRPPVLPHLGLSQFKVRISPVRVVRAAAPASVTASLV